MNPAFKYGDIVTVKCNEQALGINYCWIPSLSHWIGRQARITFVHVGHPQPVYELEIVACKSHASLPAHERKALRLRYAFIEAVLEPYVEIPNNTKPIETEFLIL